MQDSSSERCGNGLPAPRAGKNKGGPQWVSASSCHFSRTFPIGVSINLRGGGGRAGLD